MYKVWSEMNEEEKAAADQVYYDAMATMTVDEFLVWHTEYAAKSGAEHEVWLERKAAEAELTEGLQGE